MARINKQEVCVRPIYTDIYQQHKGYDNEVDYYTAYLLNTQDYYPFGMLMPGRTFSNSGYRYGYNGQEWDNEITGVNGANYTATFWEYDSRLGRRWNLDPKPQISISDYVCFGDNPIWYNDLLGDSKGWYETKSGKAEFNINVHSQEDLSDKGIEGEFIGETMTRVTPDDKTIYGDQYGNISDAAQLNPAEVTASNTSSPQGKGGWYDNAGVYITGATLTAEDIYNNYIHNHSTYTTTKGVVKNIYKANGEVRSARAAQFARTSTTLKVLGTTGTALMTAQAGTKIYNGSATAWDYADFTVGSVGTVAGTAELIGGASYAVPGLGEAVAAYSWFRLWFDLGAQYGPSKWYGKDDNRWLK